MREGPVGRGRFKMRHLLLVAGVGETGSLGLAAQGMRITQPAASRLLSEIETIVGAQVFDRLPRGLSPNAYGEVLLRRAQGALSELDAATDEIDALRSGLSGSVTLGTVTGPAVTVVAQALTDIQVRSPRLQIAIEVAPSPVLVRMLLDGKLDLVLARIPGDVDASLVDYRQVDDEELSFLVREDHPLAARDDLRLADVAAMPWVMEPPGSLLRRRMDAVFRSAGLAPPIQVLNTSSLVLAIAVMARGRHVGALVSPVADMCLGYEGLRRLGPLADVGRITIGPLGLMRRRDQAMSPAIAYVLASLQECYLTGGGATGPDA
ncbi:LysR substrate-binding domain-containing protein [Methylobacterium oryzae]|uniref:LysR family transcriptional regulator n=1 Tax=Methylobacterium oryzae TaxID=334852 RepID=A0ABU7TS77_9HYPH